MKHPILVRRSVLCLFASIALVPAAPASAKTALAVLPPELPWHGASEALIAKADDPWITPSEASGLTTTPRYEPTMAWLERLASATRQVKLVTIGTSPEGRAIRMVVVSKEGAATAEELRANGRPTLLAQAGIHAGEIDGKDAGLMLLRDLTISRTKHTLLERANLLFVPIFNVDGHERFHNFTRINQRGPEAAGWRTTATNLNINRDYMKLDAPETRAMIQTLRAWAPELYVDLHVTDGGDYQADVTFGWTHRAPYSPAIEAWLDERFRPAAEHDLTAAGHVPGPLALLVGDTIEEGILDWNGEPRFSTSYGTLRHQPTILVENHALKSYRRRVLGTYVFLESALRSLGERGDLLRHAIDEDRARRLDPLPIAFGPRAGSPPKIRFQAIGDRVRDSAVTGGKVVEWTGKPAELDIPYPSFDAVVTSVKRPKAYWIPPGYDDVTARLALHGVQAEVVWATRRLELEAYRLSDPQLGKEPFEGRVQVTAGATIERRTFELPPGSVRVATDQPLGDLAISLLEPAAPDSFFQWGFFLGCLQRTEYADGYVMEPTAQAMLANDPALKAEFEAKLASDPKFAGDPAARLDFFYRRSVYYDERYLLYPVLREP